MGDKEREREREREVNLLPYVGGVDVLATKTLGINKFNCCPKKSENKQAKKI